MGMTLLSVSREKTEPMHLRFKLSVGFVVAIITINVSQSFNATGCWRGDC